MWLILQPMSADGSESSIFDSSADVGWKWRCAEVLEGVRKFRKVCGSSGRCAEVPQWEYITVPIHGFQTSPRTFKLVQEWGRYHQNIFDHMFDHIPLSSGLIWMLLGLFKSGWEIRLSMNKTRPEIIILVSWKDKWMVWHGIASRSMKGVYILYKRA
jgi:hypothetical protein